MILLPGESNPYTGESEPVTPTATTPAPSGWFSWLPDLSLPKLPDLTVAPSLSLPDIKPTVNLSPSVNPEITIDIDPMAIVAVAGVAAVSLFLFDQLVLRGAATSRLATRAMGGA